MAKVFISHSWEDNGISRKLAEYLKRDGAEIWIDYARISGGDSLPEMIGEAIDWCDTMVLIWSKKASKSYFVKLEWTSALTNQKPIIPCIIDDAKLPTILSSRLYRSFIDFEEGYRQLSGDLELPLCRKEGDMSAAPKEKSAIAAVTFRSQSENLSIEDIEEIIKRYDFFDHHLNKKGKGFTNEFEVQSVGNVRLVIDLASGLMWQQSGSSDLMRIEDTEEWIKELNGKCFASYHDWRLPTLEEAMSVLEPRKKNKGLYIEPVFDKEQRWIWICDILQPEERPCAIDLRMGRCLYGVIYVNRSSVRAVRSWQPSWSTYDEKRS